VSAPALIAPVAPTGPELPAADGGPRRARRLALRWQLLILVVVWIALWYVLNGRWVLETGVPATLQDWFQQVETAIGDNRLTSPLFLYVFTPITHVLQAMYDAGIWVTAQLGWTGMTAVGTALALVVAGWRLALLTLLGFLSFGVLGLWDESMQTLILVIVSVLISLIIGVPLGIAAGLSDRFNRILLPILDTLQIMPGIAYLPIITLFVLIGPPSGIVATIIYAAPPTIRFTSVGIREVAPASVEAARSLGATTRQVLTDVQLPMARRTIVVGINQTVMAALSMITIAALVATPGLGQVVLGALQILDIGAAFNAGLAILVMAIVLDRVITAASRRSGTMPAPRRQRLIVWGVAAAMVVVGAVIPSIVPSTAKWNASWIHGVKAPVDTAAAWIREHLFPYTSAFTEWFTHWVINPLESLFTGSPFFVVIGVIAALALMVGRLRTAAVAVLCLVGCVALGLWPSSMVTLTQVILAAIITLALGLVFGVWIGRSAMADRLLRPLLDAGQVLPPFVYLVPCLALFGPTRFTAIFAAIIYAGPAAIKIIGEGIATVPPNTIEASRSVGASRWQEIVKVQVPMARPIILVALNQGIVYVMAMVVIGGLVGGGGLGFDVVTGFSQERFAGVGLAAGFAIVLLGVMLDRVSQSAGSARRSSSGAGE
jgi:glycine betaine/proline transport system permease protein